MKTGSLIKNCFISCTTCRTERLSSTSNKTGRQRDFKNPNFQTLLVNLKIWKCSLNSSKMLIFHLFHELRKSWKYTQTKTNISKFKFWIYGWTEKSYLCSNLSFTVVEKKMGNSHKKGLSHFNLKVVTATFLLVCFSNLNESTCQTRKNVFYFTSKALFILEKIKF